MKIYGKNRSLHSRISGKTISNLDLFEVFKAQIHFKREKGLL